MVLKLFIYGEVIETQMGGERAAHFFEYSGEMFNDIFAFMFTYIRFMSVNQQFKIALYGSSERAAALLKAD
jgi:hypothetical protein